MKTKGKENQYARESGKVEEIINQRTRKESLNHNFNK